MIVLCRSGLAGRRTRSPRAAPPTCGPPSVRRRVGKAAEPCSGSRPTRAAHRHVPGAGGRAGTQDHAAGRSFQVATFAATTFLALVFLASPVSSQPATASASDDEELTRQITEARARVETLQAEADQAEAVREEARQAAVEAREAAEAAEQQLRTLEEPPRAPRAERNAARAKVETLRDAATRLEAARTASERENLAASVRLLEARARAAALERQAEAVAARQEADAAQERAEAAEERARTLEEQASASEAERDAANREAAALRAEAAEKEAARAASEQEAEAAEARANEAEEQVQQAQESLREAEEQAEALQEDLVRTRLLTRAALVAGAFVLVGALLVAWRFARRRRRELEAAEAARRATDEQLASAILPASLSCLLEGRDLEDGRPVVIKVGAEQLGSPEGVVVGRSPRGSGVLIDHAEASRKHFRLTVRDDTLFVVDLHSTNGTFVNGEAVDTEEPTPLRTGDVIGVGTAIELTVSTD